MKRSLETALGFFFAMAAAGCGPSSDLSADDDASVFAGAGSQEAGTTEGGASAAPGDADALGGAGPDGGRPSADAGRGNDAAEGGGGSSTTGMTGGDGGSSPSDGGQQGTPGGGDAGSRDAGSRDAGGDGAVGTVDSGGGGASCSAPAVGSKGTNPLFTDQFSADPAAFVHDCTFYIQCGHDEAASGQNAFVMREWFLLASTDMVHWTKNVAMRLSDFKWANANAWAGQMVTKGGKFYWYVPVQESSTGAMAIGVAVADHPTGPFTDALGKPLINDAFEMSNVGFANPAATPFTIDPTVFVDDDGQAYLHYGGFGRMLQAKLNDNMISINGKMQEVTPQGFFEAPFLTKRNGTYYEIYAAGQNPAAIDYATSNSPLGPWTRKGRVLEPFALVSGQDAPTNHAGVAQFAGQWFIVYHVSNGPNGGGTYRREVAIDKLNFNADGTIQKVMPSTTGLTF